MARKMANESMVLLKNDGVLPLKNLGHQDCGGRSAGRSDEGPAGQLQRHSQRTPSPSWKGLKAEFPGATITYVPGTQFLSKEATPVPARC